MISKKKVFQFIFSSGFLFANPLCRQKIEKELFLINDYQTWIIDSNHSFAFIPNQINLNIKSKDINISKRDPILGLSLFESKIKFTNNKEPIKIRIPRKPHRFVMTKNMYTLGYISKPQIGLNFGEFSEILDDNLRIINGCCATNGITIGNNKFIDIDFISHFINSSNSELSDLGIFFIDKNSSIFIKYSNPFFENNKFLEGDEVLYVNNHRPEKLEKLLKNILFSKVGSVFQFEVLRNKELLEFNMTTAELKSGGLLSDSFMENLGIWFDEGLFVANIHKKSAFAKNDLKPNYKIININDIEVKSEEDIKKYFSSQKKNMPEVFQFLFRHKDKGDLTIQLKPNPKYFKSDSANANSENSGSWNFDTGNSGDFSNNFSDSSSGWNFGTTQEAENDTNETFYEIFNKKPLVEYLKSYY
jgi:hypothetical protein